MCLRTGRVLSEPFMKLPSKRELPDYYEVIKKPLDIKKIMNRIEDGKVSTKKHASQFQTLGR